MPLDDANLSQNSSDLCIHTH